MNDVWRVQLGTGEVRMMSLDELDRAFDAGFIHERTNVLAPGSFKWTTLGDAAGLNEPEPPSYVEQTPSLAPMAIAGASQYSLPNMPAYQPYSSSMSSFGLDDDDFGGKKSKKGLVFGFMVAAAAAACAFFVTTGKLNGVIHAASGASESKASAALAPAAEQKLPAPAKVEEKKEEPKTTVAGMSEDMKKKLLEADQLRADKIKSKLEKAGKKAGRRLKGRPDGDSAPSNPEGGKLIQGGDKYDPLNGSI